MYVYLLQPAVLVGTNRYKIGMSREEDLSRIKSYKRGTRYLMIIGCTDTLDVERKLVKEFNSNYNLIAGHEYFEADDELEMINRFNKIVMDHKNEINVTMLSKYGCKNDNKYQKNETEGNLFSEYAYKN